MKYLSVSKILDKIWPFDESKIDSFILERAVNKGNCIHKQLENYILYKTKPLCPCPEPLSDHNQIDIVILEIIDNLTKTHNLFSEYPIKDNNLKIRGIVDLWCESKEWGEQDIIIDWKTNSSSDKKKWRVQTALYNRLIYGNWDSKNTKLQVIHINNEISKNGKPKLNKNGWKIIDFEPLTKNEIETIENIIKELTENELYK